MLVLMSSFNWASNSLLIQSFCLNIALVSLRSQKLQLVRFADHIIDVYSSISITLAWIIHLKRNTLRSSFLACGNIGSFRNLWILCIFAWYTQSDSSGMIILTLTHFLLNLLSFLMILLWVMYQCSIIIDFFALFSSFIISAVCMLFMLITTLTHSLNFLFMYWLFFSNHCT